MEILFFTEEQKQKYFKSKRFESGGEYWEFIKTPDGWILPSKALLYKGLNLKEKDLIKREHKNTDKIIPEII